MHRNVAIFLNGRSGCGKGTVIEGWRSVFNFLTLPTSAELRARRVDPVIDKILAETADQGFLAPDNLVIETLIMAFGKMEFPFGSHVLVTDGMPRNHRQAQFGLRYFGISYEIISVVVDTDEPECDRRMIKRDRPGETAEIRRNRLGTWNDTDLAIWYMAQCCVPTIHINGNLPEEQMVEEAQEKVTPYLPMSALAV